jgi:hypothetical protein
MDIEKLERKLTDLRTRLAKLEGEEMEKILEKRLRNDMGDDFRENEGAKLVQEDHEFLHLRVTNLKQEILLTKKHLIALRSK